MPLSLPTFPAGGKVRASQLAQLVAALNTLTPLSAIKPTDENRSTANTGATLTDDPALVLPLAANITYWLDLAGEYTEAIGNTIDMKHGWTFPAGCRLDLANVGPHQGWTNAAALETEWAASNAVTTSPYAGPTYGTANGVNFSLHIRGVIRNGANAGNLRFQWAQGTANAANLTLRAGTTLTLTQLP